MNRSSLENLEKLKSLPRVNENTEIAYQASRIYSKLELSVEEPMWLCKDSLLLINNEKRADRYVEKAKLPISGPADVRMLGFKFEEYIGLLENNNIAVLINNIQLSNSHTLYVPFNETLEEGPELLQTAMSLRSEDLEYYFAQSNKGRIFWSNGITFSLKYSHVHGMNEIFSDKYLPLTEAVHRGDIDQKNFRIKFSNIWEEDIFLPCVICTSAEETLEKLRRLELNGYPADFFITQGVCVIVTHKKGSDHTIHILPETNTNWFWRPSAEMMGYLIKPSFVKIIENDPEFLLVGDKKVAVQEVIKDYMTRSFSLCTEREEILKALG